MLLLRSIAAGLVIVAATMPPAAVTAGPAETAASAGCNLCHVASAGTMGPSYQDIAARYADNADAVDTLFASTRNGSTGVWGDMPMMAVDAAIIGDDDLKAVIAWILEH